MYTHGPDFRFICFNEIITSAQFNSNALWLKKVFVDKAEFRDKKEFFEKWEWNKLKAPINNLKMMDSDTWHNAMGANRIQEARKLAPDIVGKEPLIVFASDGIHLLEDQWQIGAWCANNKLLDKLDQPPPWCNDSTWLDEPMSRIYQDNRFAPPAMKEEGSKTQKDNNNNEIQVLWPGDREALEDDVLGVLKVEDKPGDYLQQTLSVLASKDLGINESRASERDRNNKINWDKSLKTTIRTFRNKTPADRLNFINSLWGYLTTHHEFNTLAQDMYEPNYDYPLDDRSSLPTSWCPRPNNKTIYYQRDGREWRNNDGIWKHYGIGFRIEGKYGEIQRTLDRYKSNNGQGMTQQRLNQGFMRNNRKLDLSETTLADESKAYFWNNNNDIFNETAVCVSRNFFGATAFPERGTGEGGAVDCALFALDCFNLEGFDSEQEQITLKALWRPGEKAFRQIKFDRIIGWVKITRKGGRPADCWKFEIASTDNWIFNPSWVPTQPSLQPTEILSYIQCELDAWRGDHTINGMIYDFARYG